MPESSPASATFSETFFTGWGKNKTSSFVPTAINDIEPSPYMVPEIIFDSIKQLKSEENKQDVGYDGKPLIYVLKNTNNLISPTPDLDGKLMSHIGHYYINDGVLPTYLNVSLNDPLIDAPPTTQLGNFKSVYETFSVEPTAQSGHYVIESGWSVVGGFPDYRGFRDNEVPDLLNPNGTSKPLGDVQTDDHRYFKVTSTFWSEIDSKFWNQEQLKTGTFELTGYTNFSDYGFNFKLEDNLDVNNWNHDEGGNSGHRIEMNVYNFPKTKFYKYDTLYELLNFPRSTTTTVGVSAQQVLDDVVDGFLTKIVLDRKFKYDGWEFGSILVGDIDGGVTSNIPEFMTYELRDLNYDQMATPTISSNTPYTTLTSLSIDNPHIKNIRDNKEYFLNLNNTGNNWDDIQNSPSFANVSINSNNILTTESNNPITNSKACIQFSWFWFMIYQSTTDLLQANKKNNIITEPAIPSDLIESPYGALMLWSATFNTAYGADNVGKFNFNGRDNKVLGDRILWKLEIQFDETAYDLLTQTSTFLASSELFQGNEVTNLYTVDVYVKVNEGDDWKLFENHKPACGLPEYEFMQGYPDTFFFIPDGVEYVSDWNLGIGPGRRDQTTGTNNLKILVRTNGNWYFKTENYFGFNVVDDDNIALDRSQSEFWQKLKNLKTNFFHTGEVILGPDFALRKILTDSEIDNPSSFDNKRFFLNHLSSLKKSHNKLTLIKNAKEYGIDGEKGVEDAFYLQPSPEFKYNFLTTQYNDRFLQTDTPRFLFPRVLDGTSTWEVWNVIPSEIGTDLIEDKTDYLYGNLKFKVKNENRLIDRITFLDENDQEVDVVWIISDSTNSSGRSPGNVLVLGTNNTMYVYEFASYKTTEFKFYNITEGPIAPIYKKENYFADGMFDFTRPFDVKNLLYFIPGSNLLYNLTSSGTNQIVAGNIAGNEYRAVWGGVKMFDTNPTVDTVLVSADGTINNSVFKVEYHKSTRQDDGLFQSFNNANFYIPSSSWDRMFSFNVNIGAGATFIIAKGILFKLNSGDIEYALTEIKNGDVFGVDTNVLWIGENGDLTPHDQVPIVYEKLGKIYNSFCTIIYSMFSPCNTNNMRIKALDIYQKFYKLSHKRATENTSIVVATKWRQSSPTNIETFELNQHQDWNGVDIEAITSFPTTGDYDNGDKIVSTVFGYPETKESPLLGFRIPGSRNSPASNYNAFPFHFIDTSYLNSGLYFDSVDSTNLPPSYGFQGTRGVSEPMDLLQTTAIAPSGFVSSPSNVVSPQAAVHQGITLTTFPTATAWEAKRITLHTNKFTFAKNSLDILPCLKVQDTEDYIDSWGDWLKQTGELFDDANHIEKVGFIIFKLTLSRYNRLTHNHPDPGIRLKKEESKAPPVGFFKVDTNGNVTELGSWWKFDRTDANASNVESAFNHDWGPRSTASVTRILTSLSDAAGFTKIDAGSMTFSTIYTYEANVSDFYWEIANLQSDAFSTAFSATTFEHRYRSGTTGFTEQRNLSDYFAVKHAYLTLGTAGVSPSTSFTFPTGIGVSDTDLDDVPSNAVGPYTIPVGDQGADEYVARDRWQRIPGHYWTKKCFPKNSMSFI